MRGGDAPVCRPLEPEDGWFPASCLPAYSRASCRSSDDPGLAIATSVGSLRRREAAAQDVSLREERHPPSPARRAGAAAVKRSGTDGSRCDLSESLIQGTAILYKPMLACPAGKSSSGWAFASADPLACSLAHVVATPVVSCYISSRGPPPSCLGAPTSYFSNLPAVPGYKHLDEPLVFIRSTPRRDSAIIEAIFLPCYIVPPPCCPRRRLNWAFQYKQWHNPRGPHWPLRRRWWSRAKHPG